VNRMPAAIVKIQDEVSGTEVEYDFEGALIGHLFDEDSQVIEKVFNEEGTPAAYIKDVAAVLGYRNAHALSQLLADNGHTSSVSVMRRGNTQIGVVTEPGIWFAVMHSKKPAARQVQDWVYGDILPAIRKTGSYGVPMVAPTALEMFKTALAVFEDHENRLKKLEGDVADVKGKMQALPAPNVRDNDMITLFQWMIDNDAVPEYEKVKGRSFATNAYNNAWEDYKYRATRKDKKHSFRYPRWILDKIVPALIEGTIKVQNYSLNDFEETE
jgi:prophage antirepressor-like protein